jgi:hypothetical protein
MKKDKLPTSLAELADACRKSAKHKRMQTWKVKQK